ncbi:hypothetical protein B0T21DRAFT_358316 [Apiosordaria backusii]|uniref:F-box domain-containing protein n=1 Tax=Apiosordaria backusii TaxID=314023 RepID=A0AA40ESL5_9PEZI|nr:hypothetical protein B0T21DRAFT_358316 [Apiosordaria backusii]
MESKTHSGITRLPVELIQHVCSFLRPTCVPGQHPYPCQKCARRRPGCSNWYRGQIDVSRFSRTCKRLRDIVQPLVFLCCSEHGAQRFGQVRRLVRLARTLISRPDLGQHMRFLMLCDVEPLESPSDRQFVQDSITNLGLPPVPDSWNTDGEPEYRLLPLELVLAHTPNLTYLHLPLDYDWQLNLLSQLPADKFSLHQLHTLEVFHYFIAGDRFDISMSAVETILSAAPNLHSLSLPSPNDNINLTAPLTNLRRLDLQESNYISPKCLTTLLASAPELEALALHWDALGDAYDDCDDRRVVDAWNAIEQRKDSLRELRLDIRSDTELGEGERDGLKDFERLEVLKVDGRSLSVLRAAWKRRNRHAKMDSFLSAFFPPDIREVTLWDLDGVEMYEAMTRFARVVAVRRYPKLETVLLAPREALSKRHEFDEWHNLLEWPAIEDELEGEFSKGGVRFKLSYKIQGWCGLE